jgi:uncharacterized protein with PhoU and TrkA domain
MKNSAEVAVGLAYSALQFKDSALAAEVATLEARSDILHDELESWVLKAAPEARNPDELRGLLRLGYASETIFDAARDMTWLIESANWRPVTESSRSGPRRARPSWKRCAGRRPPSPDAVSTGPRAP